MGTLPIGWDVIALGVVTLWLEVVTCVGCSPLFMSICVLSSPSVVLAGFLLLIYNVDRFTLKIDDEVNTSTVAY